MATSPPQTVEPAASAPPGRRGRRRHVPRWTTRDIGVLALLLGVPVLLDVALIWGPTFASVALSFTSWDGVGDAKPVGVANYEEAFTINPQFWPAMWHNLLWLAFLGLVATPLALFFAVLLDKGIRLGRFYQSTLYLPVVLSLAVVGFITQLIYSYDIGALNSILGNTENPTDWLGDPNKNIWAVLLMVGWRHTGYVMVLYLAGLKSVDPVLKEAATVDGANEVQTFLRVIFPALAPINIIVLVITVIEALRAFDIVYVVNGGRNGLELLSILVVDNIIGEASRIGYGSAIAVVMLVISVGFIVTYLWQQTREDRQ